MKRLSSEQRKTAIIQAVTPLFAEKGFNGVTIKEIAQAAGVSEALLYKHFPSKEAMYSDIQGSACCSDLSTLEAVGQLKASTLSLVSTIYFMVDSIVTGRNSQGPIHHSVLKKLMLHSLAEDGKFAKIFIKERTQEWLPYFEKFIKAAQDSGDMVKTPAHSYDSVWFGQHLAVMLGIYLMHPEPVVDYQDSGENLVKQAVWFILRGMGLKDEAIEQYYNPEMLEMMARGGGQP